jgi:SET domain-containing protein
LRDIHPGEELCISYGGLGVLWFEDADTEEVRAAEHKDRTDEANEHGESAMGGLLHIQLDAESS